LSKHENKDIAETATKTFAKFCDILSHYEQSHSNDAEQKSLKTVGKQDQVIGTSDNEIKLKTNEGEESMDVDESTGISKETKAIVGNEGESNLSKGSNDEVKLKTNDGEESMDVDEPTGISKETEAVVGNEGESNLSKESGHVEERDDNIDPMKVDGENAGNAMGGVVDDVKESCTSNTRNEEVVDSVMQDVADEEKEGEQSDGESMQAKEDITNSSAKDGEKDGEIDVKLDHDSMQAGEEMNDNSADDNKGVNIESVHNIIQNGNKL